MKKLFCMIFGIIAVCTNLAGCSKEPAEEPASDNNTPSAVIVTSAESFEYTLSGDGQYITVNKFIGNDTDVVIPDKIEGVTVSAIEASAFAQTEIESVVVPESINAIPDTAFFACQKLHTVTLGESVEQIGKEAFKNCSALKSVNLPSGLMSIGSDAFYKCASLQKIKIPNSVTNIGINAFCYSGLDEVIFEDGIQTVGQYASFWCPKLKSVTVPASVLSIKSNIFADTLESVTFLGDAPQTIGKSPFAKNTVIYYNPDTNGWDSSPLKDGYTLKTGNN